MELTITYRYLVGIDISKNTLDMHLHDRKSGQGHAFQVSNDPEGFERLGQWLDRHHVGQDETVLCSEHTGRYGELLLRWTTEAGWPHAVVKTTALKKVGPDHGPKTDAVDARGLANYADRFTDRLQLAEAPKQAIKQLKRLRGERRRMVDQRASLRQKYAEANYHDADMEELLGMWEEQLDLLSSHISTIEERIDTLIGDNQQLAERHRQMRTAPGMGAVIGCQWLTLFAGEQTLDSRKVSARFGFAPHAYSSGTSVKKPNRSSGFGHSAMRRNMYQAARSVATHSPHYRNYYHRKKDEGKHERVVINNIINKLIDLYCAMWNNRTDYDPDYIQKMNRQQKKSA